MYKYLWGWFLKEKQKDKVEGELIEKKGILKGGQKTENCSGRRKLKKYVTFAKHRNGIDLK